MASTSLEEQATAAEPQAATIGDTNVLVVDKLLKNLTESTLKSFPKEEQRRLEYQQRLQSFQSATYFCKPIELSPIVLARFGWQNTGQDIVQCAACKATLAITFRPELSKNATQHLINLYEQQLAESHACSCPFRNLAVKYFVDDNQLIRSPINLLASVLHSQEAALLELHKPTAQLQSLTKQIVAAAKNKELQQFASVPKSILSYCRTPTTTTDSVSATPSGDLVNRMIRSWGLGETNADASSNLCAAAYLTLFGWRLADSNSDTDMVAREGLDFSCPFCLASLHVPYTATNEADTSNGNKENDKEDSSVVSPSHKRLRSDSAPWSAHRYYCVMSCGFGKKNTAKPLWQCLADKYCGVENVGNDNNDQSDAVLGQEEASPSTSQPGVSAWMHIHQLLNKGISNHKYTPNRKRRHSS